MAAGDHFGATVGLGEGVDGGDQGVADGRAGAGYSVETVVRVQTLRGFAGVDLDRLGGGQQIARLQEPVENGQDPRLLRQILEHPGASHQGVDPLCPEALEVVATVVCVLEGRQTRSHGGDHLRAHEVLDHRKALRPDPGRVGLGVKACDRHIHLAPLSGKL